MEMGQRNKWKALRLNGSSPQPPILVQPDQDRQFWLDMDASGYSTGAVLSQLCEENKWNLVGFTSTSLSSAKRNYKIHDKELLSVI